MNVSTSKLVVYFCPGAEEQNSQEFIQQLQSSVKPVHPKS